MHARYIKETLLPAMPVATTFIFILWKKVLITDAEKEIY